MSDATPAYRGYRLQTLYILARILESDGSTELIFQPEGAEDFAIWEKSNRLLETVQVKAYSSDLTLSVFSPEKVDSFFYRAAELLNNHPESMIKIASFGEIGVELLKATQADGKERQNIAKKLAKQGFLSEVAARKLLDKLQIVIVIESELEARIMTVLRNLGTGIDPVSAFDILNFWLYRCAEDKREITQSDLIQKINDVGKFIAECNAHHAEWFRSIVPIEHNEIDTQGRKKLANEFYRGISARYDHILAGVDKPRMNKLIEISQKFKDKRVVIVHGASGQGKTTIAYRYLHDFFPDRWRYQIRLVENRQHAINIATALSGHAKAIGIPIAVYLDVAPNDLGWDELIKQLSSHQNIQILVTVREEDFRRASISSVETQFAEVELQFSRSEAAEIYQQLVETEIPPQFLDFDDAWNRFGGKGQLMEFVYFVTQGDSLRERLRQQIGRLQDEVRAGRCSALELKLLRLVSVASAFESRLKLKELVDFLQLPAPQRTLELLEEEYLLRTSENGTLVSGLHPIRSTILTEILTDPTLHPWADSASTCLHFIFERDIGSFLLYAFSRHRLELNPLLFALDTYQPKQWIAVAGIVRALIWLGMKEYIEINRPSLENAFKFSNHAWWVFLNFDVHKVIGVTSSSDYREELVTTLMENYSEDQQSQIESIENGQTDRMDVFIRVTKWLALMSHEPTPPQSELEWLGMAEVIFWIGLLQIPLPILDWLERIDLDLAVTTLPLETLADLALGLFYGNKTVYRLWMDANYPTLIDRFCQETQTVELEDDGQNMRIHFIFDLFKSYASTSEVQAIQKDDQRDLNFQAVQRLELLRRFFPDREHYASQGYGHLIWDNTELPDETAKNIPRSNLPLQWLVSINSMFITLGDRYLRPDTWEDYTQAVMELRQTQLQVLQQIDRGVEVYFRQQEPLHIVGEYIEIDLYNNVKQLLECSPSLPRCAFDEWGFVADSIDRNNDFNEGVKHQNQNLALEKYNAYTKAFIEYIRTCSNFFGQADYVLYSHPYLKNGEDDRVREVTRQNNIDLNNLARLSVLNLADAWKSLPNLQEEFRKLLSPFVESQELHDLELLEQEVFNSLWYSWYFFAFHPDRKFRNTKQGCVKQFNDKVKEITSSIRKELRAISSTTIEIGVISEKVQWETARSLWLKIDGESVFEVYENVELVVKAIQRAIGSVYDDELRRYAIDLTWLNMVIVPLVRGKSLDATAWRLPSNRFSVNPEQDLGWWNFVPVAIPSNAFSQLKLSTWNYPHLTIAQKLIGSISQLSIIASHLRDFERLPELDERGCNLHQHYIKQCSIPFTEAFQAVIDVEAELFGYFNEVPSLEKPYRSHLTSAIQGLLEVNQQILPTNDLSEGIEISMNLEEIADLSNQLNAVRQEVLSIYLFLVSDILEGALVIPT
jgi:hypothetical protein